MSKEILSQVANLAEEFFQLIDKELKIEIVPGETEDAYIVKVETPDPGILIGFHGERLYAIQFLLGLGIYRKTGTWQRVILDVGDYRIKRHEVLEKMALTAAQKVNFSGEEYPFPPMPAAERRIIHMVLTENPQVATESRGEGRDRHLVVVPKR